MCLYFLASIGEECDGIAEGGPWCNEAEAHCTGKRANLTIFPSLLIRCLGTHLFRNQLKQCFNRTMSR